MELDSAGYRYLLIMGCVFSMYIEAVLLRDQTAFTIVNSLWKTWITRHGCPLYVLSDQGSNVDGEAIRKICSKFCIEKRRTSAYHSQGNGFAYHNQGNGFAYHSQWNGFAYHSQGNWFADRIIRIIREIMRKLLLDNYLPQSSWRNILPSVVFSLTPFEVIYGRYPALPYGLIFDTVSAVSPVDYLKDVKLQTRDTWRKGTDELKVSRERMQTAYNKDLKFFNYQPGERVRVKAKTFKPGETRKLSRR